MATMSEKNNLINGKNSVAISIPIASQDETPSLFAKMMSAVFYATVSFCIVVVNKVVLTSYSFPSFQFLGIGQIVATILVSCTGKQLGIINYPDIGLDCVKKIWPLPVLFLGNLICGLGGTKQLSLPMFTVLRRFSILMTLVAEFYILGVIKTRAVKLSVAAMIGGALIAALNDLGFDMFGYLLVLSNDFFTAAYGVFIKQKLESKEIGKYGLMFYNSLLMLFPALLVCHLSGELEEALEYKHWSNSWFLVQFLLSCFMGYILIFSTILCTAYNSPLTTTIIGCLKNIFVTYVGMFLGGDYIFSWLNFIGLNISVIGSLVYTWVTFRGKENASS